MKSITLIMFSLIFFSCNSIKTPLSSSDPSGVTNFANMLNERGYYKSNGISLDEQEIINDFNGNLLIEKPLYNFELAGDVKLNLSLNYNGSVGHQFFIGDTSSYEIESRRYNLNVAEWIISLNGIAIQTLNFETNFFTDPQRNIITGDSIRLLIPGYHFDGPLEPPISNAPNDILILAGDGSVITLENKYSDTSFTGTYAYKGKDFHYKGQVSYIEEGYYGFRRRKLELMKGDGAIYEFIEY